MTGGRAERIRTLFESALGVPDVAARRRWLQTATGGDADLVAEVEGLLAADAEPLQALDATPDELLEAVRPPPERMPQGETVGPYRLVRELGRGGMGTVYLAEREDVGLRVALKLLRPGAGLASPDHVARFVLERRLLARLEHPLIARLLDGGVTPDGIHWLAMELVDGEPITGFCDRLRLDIDARLRLFEAVCDAVSYAHRNLVVHRDLKPGNILVVGSDGEWRPKLLDFGIAKLLEDDADGETITVTGRWPLTPEYAAPEQLQGLPVTTATDVYALGVLLFELLTGRRPHHGNEREWTAVARSLRHTPLPRPSTVVTRRGTARGPDPAAVAAARRLPPERLGRTLAGDLDNIVSKAMEAEPARRYESAAALADDLRRYREGRPVRARAPTAGYRARKFVARNRAGVVAAGLVLVSLLAGLGTSLWHAAEADRARQSAERALQSSEQVRGFLASLFNARSSLGPRGTALTMTEVLEQGLRQAEQLADQPLVQADVLDEIGQVYYGRGEFEHAESVFRRVLEIREATVGPSAPATGEALRRVGDAVRRRLHFDEAEALYQRALSVHEATVGDRHPAYASVLVGLASLATFRGDLRGALGVYERVLEIRRAALGPDDPSVAETLRLLAVTRRRLGDHTEATSLYRQAVERHQRIHGADSPEAAWAMVHLADQYASHNMEPTAAEPLYEEALRILRARLGNGHPNLLHALHSLAGLRRDMGQFDAAEALYRESMEIVRRYYGEENWRMAYEIDMLGILFRERGDFDRAEALHRRALAMFERLYPSAHRYPLSVRSSLFELYVASGDYQRAEAVSREALALREQLEGPEAPPVAQERERLGRVLLLQGRLDEAELQFLPALEITEAQRSDRSAAVRRLLGYLVELYQARGDTATAERYQARLAADRTV